MKKKKILIPLLILLAFFVAGGVAVVLMHGKSVKINGKDCKTNNSGIKPVKYTSVKDKYWDDYYLDSFEYSKDKDTDKDGLNDYDEKNTYKTSAFTCDTDGDGLGDYNEVMKYKTDPNNPDSDGDSVLDGDEVMARLDTLKKSSDGKTNDSKRKFENECSEDACTLNLKGYANIYSVLFNKMNITGMANTPGVVSDVYEVYSANAFEKATITITYDSDLLKKSKLDADDLTICSFENDLSFKKVKSKVDKDSSTVSAQISGSGKYVLVANSIIGKNPETDVMLLIDDSGSMYPREMCSDSTESDVEFKRIDMAKSLIEMSDDSINYGLATFTATYCDQCKIGSSKKELNSKLDAIKTQQTHNFDGTYIARAIHNAVDSFDENAMKKKKYVVLLTDGCSTEGGLFDFSSYLISDEIDKAKDKNVTVIVVALGNYVDVDYLTKITSGTNGTYIYASNANALEQLYNAIMNVIKYNYEDTSGDGVPDEFDIADSGFDVNVDAFSFHNMYLDGCEDAPLQEGLCSGISTFSELYYMGKMPATVSDMNTSDYDDHRLRGFSKFLDYVGLYDADDIRYETSPGFGPEIWKLCGFETDGNYVMKNKDLFSFTTSDIQEYEKLRQLSDNDTFEIRDGKIEIKKDVVASIKSPILMTGKSKSEIEFDGVTGKMPVITYALKDFDSLSDDNKKTYSMLYILYRLWYAQFDSSNFETYTLNDDFDNVVNMINTGNPLYVSIPSHAINAISLSESLHNLDTYYLRTYDNNFPGEERIYYIKRKIVDGECCYTYFNPVGEPTDIEFQDYTKLK